jgi:hypothetical protein
MEDIVQVIGAIAKTAGEIVKSQVELLLPIIDDLKKEMIPSNLDQDLNREELENMLSS